MTTGLAIRRRFVLVLGCLTGLAAVSIDLSLPAIPAMVRDLGADIATGQQIVGLFVAGLALGQLPAGLLSDRLGRMPVLIGGVGLFTLAGLACALSTSIELLLAARFVQGLASSVGVVVSRAIVRDIASGRRAARLLSVMVMIFTAAPMLAPMLGALLVTAWGWRLPFVAIVVFGVLLFYGINTALSETHVPTRDHHIVRQLALSTREFFSHRQCILGVLLVLLPAAGFMSLITSSSALVIDIYGFDVHWFGPIFALAGLAILLGSVINRRLLHRFGTLTMMGAGAGVIGLAALQLLAIAMLGEAPFAWLWGTVCLYMFGVSLVLPNATAIALDPVPGIAGVAASLLGTIQNVSGATSSVTTGLIYDGTVKNVVTMMGVFGVATAAAFLGRRLVLGDRPLHVPEEG